MKLSVIWLKPASSLLPTSPRKKSTPVSACRSTAAGGADGGDGHCSTYVASWQEERPVCSERCCPRRADHCVSISRTCTIASGREASLRAATLSAIISTVCASSVRRRPGAHGTSHCWAFSVVLFPHERQTNGGGDAGGGGLGVQRAVTLVSWQVESPDCRPRRIPQSSQSASRCEFSSALRGLVAR